MYLRVGQLVELRVANERILDAAFELVEEHHEVGRGPVEVLVAPPTLRVVEERLRLRHASAHGAHLAHARRGASQVPRRHVAVQVAGTHRILLAAYFCTCYMVFLID
jgi:hypothetical protein